MEQSLYYRDTTTGTTQEIMSRTDQNPTPIHLSLPPDHPASIQFSHWLAAFNTAGEQTLVAYHSGSIFPYSVASRDIGSLQHELRLARASEGFNVIEAESISSPSTLVVVLREKKRPQYVRVSISVDVSNPDYPVTKFEIHPINTPLKYIPKDDPRRAEFEKALAPLTAERRKMVVEGLKDVLREQYVYPGLVEKITSALDTSLENGEYDGFEDSEKFAQRLTSDLHSTAHDLHMSIAFREPHPPLDDNDDSKPKPRKLFEHFKIVNFQFGDVVLDTDCAPGKVIATLPINGFVPSTEEHAEDWKKIQAAIGNIVSSVADADALIIDLRNNGGGVPHTVVFIESYILDDAPLHLLDFVDQQGKTHNSFFTTPENNLPSGTQRFGGTKPLYILTSKNTISGGEDMAYNLQAFKRTSAIIGEGNETTAGQRILLLK
ncbi:hypothetical protein B7463_g9394, partial [Scytalidium lignicola]